MTEINIIFGLAVGFVFGYALTRTGITKYPRVMGMLLLKDFKILKFMLTAVIASLIVFHIFGDLGLLKVVPKNLDWGKLVGGLVFGAGMGILGYCPGTMAARIGEGKRESIFAALRSSTTTGACSEGIGRSSPPLAPPPGASRTSRLDQIFGLTVPVIFGNLTKYALIGEESHDSKRSSAPPCQGSSAQSARSSDEALYGSGAEQG